MSSENERKHLARHKLTAVVALTSSADVDLCFFIEMRAALTSAVVVQSEYERWVDRRCNLGDW